MKAEQRKVPDEWYDEEVGKSTEWVFKDEFLKYCDLDTKILWQSMVKFKCIFLVLVGLDLLQCITIAIVCMATYRAHFMPVNSIEIKKFSSDNYSEGSINWIRFMEHKVALKFSMLLMEVRYILKTLE